MTVSCPKLYARKSESTGEARCGIEFKLHLHHGERISRRQLEEKIMGALATDWAILKAAIAAKDQTIAAQTAQIATLQAEVPDAADVAAAAEIDAAAKALTPAPADVPPAP
jgi:hypothetical protein